MKLGRLKLESLIEVGSGMDDKRLRDFSLFEFKKREEAGSESENFLQKIKGWWVEI